MNRKPVQPYLGIGEVLVKLRAEFPDIIELVDFMQYQAKKIIRSALSREGVL